MNPNEKPEDQKVPNNVSVNDNQHLDDLGDPAMPRMEKLPFVPDQKMTTPAQKTINVVGIILSIPLVIVLIVIILVVAFSVGHGADLNKLKSETSSLFQDSGFAVSGYDCHDVELRNECSFNIATPSSKVSAFLVQNGFTLDSNTYGTAYRKGNFYVVSYQKGSYHSYYQSN